MGQEISWETRQAAQELYITEYKTYEQVSKLTGVSVSQLKRWSKEEQWSEEREEYRKTQLAIRQDKIRLRAKLLQTALQTQNPQNVYAFASVEQLAIKEQTSAQKPEENYQKIRDIRTPAQAIEALDEVVEIRLNRLLNKPETLRLSDVKEIKQVMEMISQLKGKYLTEKEEKQQTGGLSDEAAEAIRKQILGVS